MQPNENIKLTFVPREVDKNYNHYLVSRKLHDDVNQEYHKQWHIITIAKHLKRQFESKESIVTNGFSDVILIWDADRQLNPQAKGSIGDGEDEAEVLYRGQKQMLTKEQMLEICDKEGLRVNKNNISTKTLAAKIAAEFGSLEPDA